MTEPDSPFKYIYGPVPSWRLGRSLGIDLMSRPNTCSFDCVYCQLGRTRWRTADRRVFVPTAKVLGEIGELPDIPIDYATFSGTGEPTLAENLGDAIDGTRQALGVPIAVLTNASLMYRPRVAEELAKADLVMAKLDAADAELFRRMNRPVEGITFEQTLGGIEAFGQQHPDKLVLQVMFCPINERAAADVARLAARIHCREIALNTPLRPCPVPALSREAMSRIKELFAPLPTRMVYDAAPVDAQAIDPGKTLWRRPEASLGTGPVSARRYSDAVLEHFRSPRNVGTIARPDGFARVGDPTCGDYLEMGIKVADDHISEIKFLCRGCPAAIACASIATELALGKHLDEASEITSEVVEGGLGGLPPDSRHCSSLGAAALYEAILDYVVRSTGLPGDHLHEVH